MDITRRKFLQFCGQAAILLGLEAWLPESGRRPKSPEAASPIREGLTGAVVFCNISTLPQAVCRLQPARSGRPRAKRIHFGSKEKPL